MTDGIIKGTGNSRYLKSVANALALYPTHESLMEALAAGTLPIDLNGINPAGWNIMGDKLDKATLLTDALCTALRLSTTATPTQAMEKLRQLVNTAQNVAMDRPRVTVGSYVGNGASSRIVYLASGIIFAIIFTNDGRVNMSNITYGGLLMPGYDLLTYGSRDEVAAKISGNNMYVYFDGGRRCTNESGTNYYYIYFYK